MLDSHKSIKISRIAVFDLDLILMASRRLRSPLEHSLLDYETVLRLWITSLCVCIAEEKRVDKSDARTGRFKSQTDDDSIDYGDDNYKRHKTKKAFLPVFVPEEEKKKCMEFKLFVSTIENRTVSLKLNTKFLLFSAISLSKHYNDLRKKCCSIDYILL